MLHLQEGTVPYLTPVLLDRCFSPDNLWLAVAVRDTCVSPVYQNSKEDAKISGYRFESTGLDEWLRPYYKIMVPSFDLLADANEDTGRVSSSRDKVLMWTSNGRVALTPDTYNKIVQDLDEIEAVLPLSGCVTKPKHSRLVLETDREWTQSAIQCFKGKKDIYFPFNCYDGIGSDELIKHHAKWIQSCDINQEFSKRIMFTHWNRLPSSMARMGFIEKTLECMGDPVEFGVLCANGWEQILDALEAKCAFVGTDFPRRLAAEKKAFLVSRWTGQNENIGPKILSLRNESISFEEIAKHPWFRDQSSPQEGCTCMTCNLHSRAYIYHLVCAKELLAEILLYIHNLHTLLEFFRAFDESGPQKNEFLRFFRNNLSEE